MSSIIFLVLACLGPASVFCDQWDWIPEEVPTVSEQCINSGLLPVCDAYFDEIPAYERCDILPCAFSADESYFPTWIDSPVPVDGSSCGDSMICKSGNCVSVPQGYRLPRQIGHSGTTRCQNL